MLYLNYRNNTTIKAVLLDIIHADQTCGIPERHIYDSIALSRDIIEYAKGCQ